ncbi:MAG TPA: 4'-phosphopantetheinyl transferase superfamily protein [Kofleriaceae bacterium]|nr:4'-phosphopantetheinyl transferase superfamily protein [Kofleriaceae bacterium]
MIATLYGNARGPLERGVVHVWRFACAQDAPQDALSDDERRAAERLAAPAHRAAYLAQRALVRAIVARYTGGAPRDLVFARSPRGKPRLVGSGLELNLSHADDVALLAIAHVRVGVDIERLDAPIDPARLAHLVLAPDEAAQRERTAFLRIWTRKEACLKANGVGLLDDLTAVSVMADRVELCGDVVYVQDLAMGAAHAAALATAAPVAPVALELATLAP